MMNSKTNSLLGIAELAQNKTWRHFLAQKNIFFDIPTFISELKEPVVTNQQVVMDFGLTRTSRLSNFLFKNTLYFVPKPLLSSNLFHEPGVKHYLKAVLASRKDFIEKVNLSIESLKSKGIATAITPLSEDYLPLFIICPDTKERLRLKYQSKLGQAYAYAYAYNRNGKKLCYVIDGNSDWIDSLSEEVDWSVDVTLPILTNNFFSGVIAGRSSALYMMVFRSVMIDLLGIHPIPILVPNTYNILEEHHDSLFQSYLNSASL